MSLGLDDVELAGSRRTRKFHRIVLDKFEVYEKFRIENIDQQIFYFNRRLERQREIERESFVLVVEPVVDRICENVFLACAFNTRIVEKAILLERVRRFPWRAAPVPRA